MATRMAERVADPLGFIPSDAFVVQGMLDGLEMLTNSRDARAADDMERVDRIRGWLLEHLDEINAWCKERGYYDKEEKDG